MSKLSSQFLLDKRSVSSLLSWFDENGVVYPWGDDPSPYRVWISEVMLQQTVVKAAIGHFQKWMTLFPDIATLALAEEQAVLKAWEGLGYYSRARNILKGAVYLMEKHHGRLPEGYDELVKVPGIGDYTARALLSLAYGRPWPVLDANVRRIGQRLSAVADWSRAEDRELLDLLDQSIPKDAPGRFNAALMQLGQLVCRTGRPDCPSCPLLDVCLARKEGREEDIPRRKKRAVKEKHTILFLILWEGSVLLIRRSRGIGEGLWFLPGTDRESSESLRRQFAPHLREAGSYPSMTHFYTTWKDFLHTEIFETDRPDLLPMDPFLAFPEDHPEWVKLEDLESYPSPSVYRRILLGVVRGLSNP